MIGFVAATAWFPIYFFQCDLHLVKNWEVLHFLLRTGKLPDDSCPFERENNLAEWAAGSRSNVNSKHGFSRHNQALTTSTITFCLRFAAPFGEGEGFLSFHVPVAVYLLDVITSASASMLSFEKNYLLSFFNADIQRESFIIRFQQYSLNFRGKVRISPIFSYLSGHASCDTYFSKSGVVTCH